MTVAALDLFLHGYLVGLVEPNTRDRSTSRSLTGRCPPSSRGPSRSQARASEGSRSTLPGCQPKVLVAQIDGQWANPRGRAHATWILQPQIPARPHRFHDEHCGHLPSRHVGLSAYRSAIRKAGRATYLAIERFDRELVDGHVQLRHQEDLAQATGLDWTGLAPT